MRGMTQSELKANLMRELETEVDRALGARANGRPLTVTEIEDVVLEVRQRMGEKIAASMIEGQGQDREWEAPMSAVTGKRLERKGKKRQH
jgi:hypothetical protein